MKAYPKQETCSGWDLISMEQSRIIASSGLHTKSRYYILQRDLLFLLIFSQQQISHSHPFVTCPTSPFPALLSPGESSLLGFSLLPFLIGSHLAHFRLFLQFFQGHFEFPSWSLGCSQSGITHIFYKWAPWAVVRVSKGKCWIAQAGRTLLKVPLSSGWKPSAVSFIQLLINSLCGGFT